MGAGVPIIPATGVIVVKHENGSQSIRNPATDSDADRGTALLAAVAAASAGDVIEVGAGTFALGDNVLNMPDGVNFFGAGKGTPQAFPPSNPTTIQGTLITSSALLTSKGCIFKPGSNSISRDFAVCYTLQPSGVNTNYQAPVGFVRDLVTPGVQQSLPVNAVIYNCDFYGENDCFYVRNVTSSPTGGSITCVNCNFYGKYDNVIAQGGQSHPENDISVYAFNGCNAMTVGPSNVASARSTGVGIVFSYATINWFGGSISASGSSTLNWAVTTGATSATLNLYQTSLLSSGTGAKDVSVAPGKVNAFSSVYDPTKVSVSISVGGTFNILDAPLINNAVRSLQKMALPTAPAGTPSITGGNILNGTYYYVVTALNSVGEETSRGAESAAIVVDDEEGDGDTGSISLSWAAVPYAVSYNVYRTTTSGSYTNKFIANVATTSYVDTNSAPSTGTPPSQNNAYLVTISASGNSQLLAGGLTIDGDVSIHQVGKGLKVKEGANAKMGSVSLSSGAATVSTTAVHTTSRIILTIQSLGTVSSPKSIAVTARTEGTSFTIASEDATDTSTIAWMIVDPA